MSLSSLNPALKINRLDIQTSINIGLNRESTARRKLLSVGYTENKILRDIQANSGFCLTFSPDISNSYDMSQKTKTLSPKQFRALASLMTSPNISSAATASGTSRSSIVRWLNTDSLFQSEYRRLRRQSFSQTTALLTSVSGLAVKCLVDIIQDPTSPVTGKVNASLGLLRMAQSGLDSDSTAAEMSEILAEIEKEKQINERY